MTPPAATIRVATFNISCSRPTAGGLLAALQAEEANAPRERLTPPKSTLPPKDYAPKVDDGPGMLDETFGLKPKV